MVSLDSDNGMLRNSHGQLALRDVVQFVAFKNYAKKDGQMYAECAQALTQEVLSEVPKQFIEYMKINNIKPDNK